MVYMLKLASLVLTSLIAVPAGAHLFAMNNKMRLSKADYLVAQRAYDGWAFFAVPIVLALLSTLVLTAWLYRTSQPYGLALASFLCVAATQVVFWLYTFPANKLTRNWTDLPDNWEVVRRQWEYSHAASAVLNFAALILLCTAVIGER